MTHNRIDVHTHYLGGSVEEIFRLGFSLAGRYTISTRWSPEAAIASMDRLGVAVELVDAPVSGSVGVAETAEITTSMGGTDAQLAQVRPVLASMTKAQFHTGLLGSASTTKLAVNLVLATLNQAIAEGLLLSEEGGLRPEVFYDVLAASAVAAPYLQAKRDAFLTPEQAGVAAPVPLIQKGLRLALKMA